MFVLTVSRDKVSIEIWRDWSAWHAKICTFNQNYRFDGWKHAWVAHVCMLHISRKYLSWNWLYSQSRSSTPSFLIRYSPILKCHWPILWNLEAKNTSSWLYKINVFDDNFCSINFRESFIYHDSIWFNNFVLSRVLFSNYSGKKLRSAWFHSIIWYSK